MAWLDFIISLPFIFSYILGSIPFGLIFIKIFTKKDIRNIGSGNIGATNVLRAGNKKLAAFTLLFDLMKGFIVVGLITIMSENLQLSLIDRNLPFSLAFSCGVFAIIGHCFPVWLKFKGGKGVATALGVLLAAVPIAGLVACGVWLMTALIFRISSLAALVAVAVAPITTYFIYGSSTAVICAMITLLVWIRHKDNIKRLLKGEEPKIGSGKKKEKNIEPVSE